MAVSTNKVDALDGLRITGRRDRERRARRSYAPFLLGLAVTMAFVGVAYALYRRVFTRPLQVETMIITSSQAGQPGILLTGSGYVVTRHKYIIVGTKILGQIVEEPIEEGQRVKKGDLLARIDDRDYEAQLRQAIADRDLADANVRLWQAKAARERELYGSGVISKDEFETSENSLAVAQSTLRRDEAAIDYAKFEVNQCLIVSPINGVVLQKYRELGDTINYGGQVQAGGGATDISQLADTGDMRAEVDINESDIAKVSLGMPAVVVPDAYPQSHFDAKLVKIYPEADRQKATVKVEVHILQPDLAMIRPEMSVKANFVEGRVVRNDDSRLFVPAKAILHEGGNSYVWTLRNGVAKRVSVMQGRENQNGVEVLRGLSDGDVLIIAPPAQLSDDQRVRTADH